MTLPSDQYARISHTFIGTGMPTGGAVVYCVEKESEQSPLETAEVCHLYFGTLIVPLMSSDITLSKTMAKDGPDATGASAETSAPPYTGAQSTTPAPPQTSVLITKNTAGGGRRGKGRMYLPGLDDPNTLDGGQIADAYVTALQAAMDDWRTTLDGAGLFLSVEHSPSYTWVLRQGQPRRVPTEDPVPDPTVITGLSVSNITATQRRRQRR